MNHNGTVLGLPGYAYVPGLATGTEATFMALDPNNPTVVMACSESHNWFTTSDMLFLLDPAREDHHGQD